MSFGSGLISLYGTQVSTYLKIISHNMWVFSDAIIKHEL